jgi:hypothetical protein
VSGCETVSNISSEDQPLPSPFVSPNDLAEKFPTGSYKIDLLLTVTEFFPENTDLGHFTLMCKDKCIIRGYNTEKPKAFEGITEL